MIVFENCRESYLHNNTIGSIVLFSLCSKTGVAAFLKKEEKKLNGSENASLLGCVFGAVCIMALFCGKILNGYDSV